MCVLCGTRAPAQTTSSGLFGERIDSTVLFTEASDVGETTATAQAIAMGEEAYGAISTGTDEDMYAVQVVSGQTYHINVVRDPSGSPVLEDPTLAIFDSAGFQIGFDDDGGYGTHSYLSYTASFTGTLYMLVDGFDSFELGSYMLSIYQDDIPETTATPAVMLVNSSVTGYSTLDGGWDDDWYAVTLTAGTTYTLTSYAANATTYGTTFVEFHDSTGTIVSSGATTATYTASTTGTYYVTSSPDESSGYGQYDLVLATGGGGGGGWEAPNLAEPLASIDWGFTAPTNINVYFAPGGLTFTDSEGTYTTVAWSPLEQAGAETAFVQFENVANVNFTTVTDINLADFIMVETNGTGALGYWGVGGGTISLGGTSYSVDGWGVFEAGGQGFTDTGTQQGGYGFVTLIHEIGHGMGLAHPHDDGGSSSIMEGVTGPFGSFGTYGLNQGIWTTMSYNDGWQTAPHGTSPSNDYGWQATMMTLDVAVLQDTYGANNTYNTGNNTYTMPTTNAAGTFYSAIWDAGGTDTIVNPGSGSSIINLNAAPLSNTAVGGGYISYVTGIHGGFTIANGVVIENATGGSGIDTITGNAANNTLTGNNGNDTLNGEGGNDTLAGGAGSDTMNGGEGDDIFNGGANNDTMNGGNGIDRVSYSTQTGNLIVYLTGVASVGFEAQGDIITNIENATGGSGNDQIYGNADANTLDGLGGNDTLLGAGGNDTLRGGDGDDVIVGGDGADSIQGGAGNDRVSYSDQTANLFVYLTGSANSGGGAAGDTLNSIENLTGGQGNDYVYGNDDANLVDGYLGNDVVYGYAGNDILRGGEGNDVLVGGAGADSLQGGNGTDRVAYSDQVVNLVINLDGTPNTGGDAAGDFFSSIEQVTAGQANDTVNGDGNANLLDGQAGNDTLNGNGGSDILRGGNGADTLNGGLGNDSLTGGADFDTFVFQDGWGIDTIVDFDTNDLEDINLAALTNITDFNDLLANHVREVGGILEIFDGANVIRLGGHTLAEVGVAGVISANDFVF
jgi:hypothetical protein